MEFAEFVNKLKPIISGGTSNHSFTRTLLEEIVIDEGSRELEDISDNTYKAYFNGKTSISKLSQRISMYIDPENFISYLDSFPDATIQRLCDAFRDNIADITVHNASEKIAYLFESILISSATQRKQRKSTLLKSASNLDSTNIKMPEIENKYELPYHDEDKKLILEFTSDYDEIMKTMISDNYYLSLMDTTLQNKIRKLYENKWKTKANLFVDLTLKSYVFALLGELNKLNYEYFDDKCDVLFIANIRKKIRNLYVKLHPDSYPIAFPYEVFIDDWNDGEY